MDSFKDKFSARFQNLMRVFEYHLGALYYWQFSVFPLLLQIVLKLSRYTNITPLLKEIEYLWSFKSSRLGLMKALFLTAARYYFELYRHIRKLHLQWKYWQNLKGMHHIRHRKFRWVTHLIGSKILQRIFHELPKYQEERIILIQASVRFVKCKYGEMISIWWLSIEKRINFTIIELIYNGLNKKTCVKTYKRG